MKWAETEQKLSEQELEFSFSKAGQMDLWGKRPTEADSY